MVGDFESENNKGIIPRAFDHIFEQTKMDSEHAYKISISFIQIYLETLMDLIEPQNEDIRIREDPEHGVYLDGVEWVEVKNTKECKQVFMIGERNRATASTK